MNIALITYADEGKYPGEGTREDASLLAYLKEQGLPAEYRIWTDATVDWHQYDALILKSPWDYFDKVSQFKTWLDALETNHLRVINPIPVIRWNLAKTYLLDIAQAGFPVVPTQILPRTGHFKADLYFQEWATQTLVVKPVISGGAKNTFILTPDNCHQLAKQINRLLLSEAFLVQPFLPEIKTQGEWSLIYFNGRFSHCVLKQPTPDDFRVQHYFGGSITPTQPPAAILEYGNQLIKHFAPNCLYARVDGVETSLGFRLMELELIEPLLYLLYNPTALQNYLQALRQLL